MLETSFVQGHNAGGKNGIQKLKITTVDLSLKRRTQKNTYLRTCRSFLKQCWLLQKPQVRAPPTREKHWKFLTLFGNHAQRQYRRQATTAPNKLATRCSSAVQLKTLSLDTKLRPKQNNPQRSGRKLYFLNAIPASELSCNETTTAKISSVVDETYDEQRLDFLTWLSREKPKWNWLSPSWSLPKMRYDLAARWTSLKWLRWATFPLEITYNLENKKLGTTSLPSAFASST
jgi:hypothetical protein